MKVGDDPAEEVKEGGGDGRVRPHRVVHDQDRRLDVHDVVLLRLEEQPVIKQRQLGVTASEEFGCVLLRNQTFKVPQPEANLSGNNLQKC